MNWLFTLGGQSIGLESQGESKVHKRTEEEQPVSSEENLHVDVREFQEEKGL